MPRQFIRVAVRLSSQPRTKRRAPPRLSRPAASLACCTRRGCWCTDCRPLLSRKRGWSTRPRTSAPPVGPAAPHGPSGQGESGTGSGESAGATRLLDRHGHRPVAALAVGVRRLGWVDDRHADLAIVEDVRVEERLAVDRQELERGRPLGVLGCERKYPRKDARVPHRRLLRWNLPASRLQRQRSSLDQALVPRQTEHPPATVEGGAEPESAESEAEAWGRQADVRGDRLM